MQNSHLPCRRTPRVALDGFAARFSSRNLATAHLGSTSVWVDFGEALLFNDATFRSEFGRPFNNIKDVVLAMNGDSVNGGYFSGVTYYSGSNNIWVGGSSISPGPLRINYVVLLAD